MADIEFEDGGGRWSEELRPGQPPSRKAKLGLAFVILVPLAVIAAYIIIFKF